MAIGLDDYNRREVKIYMWKNDLMQKIFTNKDSFFTGNNYYIKQCTIDLRNFLNAETKCVTRIEGGVSCWMSKN